MEYKWPLMHDAITMCDRLKVAKFALTTKKFTKGDECEAFEKEWNDWLGSKYSLFVSSGSTANFLLVAAVIEKYGLKPGDKVLLPACTWVTNVAPIIQLGLEPVFCDINLENFSFDMGAVKYISETETDIKMVFVTHLLGFPADTEYLKKLFPDAIFIDDVCESHGAVDKDGNKIGSNSIGATYSFYFGHHMTTIEGGMVSTNDPELYDIMKMKRSHGMARESLFFKEYAAKSPNLSPQFLFITDGYNFRNHEIPALIGRSQLSRLDKSISIRRENYELFRSHINRNEKFYTIQENPGNSSFCFPVVCKSPETKIKLEKMLEDNKIEYRPIVGGNLLKHPFLSKYNLISVNDIPNADILNDLGLYIGNSQFVDKNDLKRLGEIINDC
jgi:CDP-6-deoxy-D-xylo-4-hexulose-3-dehydrase